MIGSIAEHAEEGCSSIMSSLERQPASAREGSHQRSKTKVQRYGQDELQVFDSNISLYWVNFVMTLT